MTDAVWGNRYYEVDRGAAGRAWHRKGNVWALGRKITAVEALEESDQDVEIVKAPTFVFLDAKGRPMDYKQLEIDPDAPLAGGVYDIPVSAKRMYRTDSFHNLRMPTHDDPEIVDFGVVGNKYTLMTNRTVCEVLDRSKIGEVFPLETLGSLGRGESFFITYDAGDWAVKGDPMHSYLFVVDFKTGARSFNIGVTEVRMVCQNTVNLGLALATINVNLQHGQNLVDDMELWLGILPQVREARARTRGAFERLAEVKLSRNHMVKLAELTYPYEAEPPLVRQMREKDMAITELKPADRARVEAAEKRFMFYRGRVDAFRETAVETFERYNDTLEPKALRGTVWAGFNALTELANYRRGHTKSEKASVMIGERQRECQRAFMGSYMLAATGKVPDMLPEVRWFNEAFGNPN
jgi:hypothetical protein